MERKPRPPPDTLHVPAETDKMFQRLKWNNLRCPSLEFSPCHKLLRRFDRLIITIKQIQQILYVKNTSEYRRRRQASEGGREAVGFRGAGEGWQQAYMPDNVTLRWTIEPPPSLPRSPERHTIRILLPHKEGCVGLTNVPVTSVQSPQLDGEMNIFLWTEPNSARGHQRKCVLFLPVSHLKEYR